MTINQAAESDFLIIGGGILGAATASYLAQLSGPDTRITIVEAGQPATGTTCQAAGLLTRLKTDIALAEMVGETYTAITRLSAQLDQQEGERRGREERSFKPLMPSLWKRLSHL